MDIPVYSVSFLLARIHKNGLQNSKLIEKHVKQVFNNTFEQSLLLTSNTYNVN